MASTDSLTKWKELAAYHRAELEEAEAHIKELEKPPVLAEPLLTQAEMRKRVLDMHKTKTLAIAWKKVVEKGGLVENVEGLLRESYHPFCHEIDIEFKNVQEQIGVIGSLKWQLFVLKVIQYLKEKDSFQGYKEGEFNKFDDTANGCDEITWDAGCYLLQNPDWTPSA